ncbi:hypothetical protein [Vibrio parahaemolyticus]|uniref:hypothetical protein n=1 Tax=Vibrio parahaemolyticus TaxID=670 RepID=UPI001EEBE830|nr:hypothetical protein [Vibrio parahaemolyticus]MCG6480938.1 hypothetical protein [Vibrio parahaemolyticus]HCG6765655.1 hypothetical protein [Vibrio parahaemolyticus]
MTLQELSDLGTFIAAVATTGSVILALVTYRKSTQRDALKGVRTQIATYRIKYEEVDDLLNTSAHVGLGMSIAQELEALVPDSKNPANVVNFLEDKKNSNFLTQACYLGLENATKIQEAVAISKELQLLSTSGQEMYPITSKLISILSLYPSSVLDTLNQTEYLTNLFQDEDAIESLKTRIDSDTIQPTVFREIALWVTLVADRLCGNISDRVAENAQPIVTIISSIFESSTDHKLLKLSRAERAQQERIFNRLRMNDIEEPHEIIFELLKFYKPYLDSEDWDTLVECKTLLGVIHQEASELDT